MSAAFAVLAGDLLLDAKATAALLGVAVQTLAQARCNAPRSARHDLFFPAPDLQMPRKGRRPHVRYKLGALQAWARQQGRPLHWDALPVSFAMPVIEAYDGAKLPLPVALELLAAQRRLPRRGQGGSHPGACDRPGPS